MRQVILNFHGLGEPERTLEVGEAPYWISSEFFTETLALAQSLKDQVNTRFTFDDGNISDLRVGAAGLARYGYTAQFFLLSSRIGQPGSLGSDDVLELQKMGHEIGNHGVDHVDWKSLNEVALDYDLEGAREAISRLTGQSVNAASIPFGRYNGTVIRALKSRGYTEVFSSDGGTWRVGQYPIPRTSPKRDMTLKDIEHILLGPESLKRRFRRTLSSALKRRF